METGAAGAGDVLVRLDALIGAVALAWIAGIVPEQWVQRAIFFGSLSVVGYLIFYTVATTSWRPRQRC